MKVRMNHDSLYFDRETGVDKTLAKGSIVDMPDDDAETFIRHGRAEKATSMSKDAPEVESKPEPVSAKKAAVKSAKKATPRTRRKG